MTQAAQDSLSRHPRPRALSPGDKAHASAAAEVPVAGAMLPDDEQREFVLTELRRGRSRALLLANEITFIGVSLRNDWISPDDAILEMAEAGSRFLDGESQQ